jgi:hypothetical protein
MSRFYILVIFFCLISGLVNAQINSEKSEVDPDSSGVVNSTLLPSSMPLLLFEDSEMKEEKNYYKNLPEYSDFEKKEMINALENWLNKNCGHFADGQKMTMEQTLEMVNEFKDNFPEEFSKMIHRKIITKELGQFNWEEESYNGKKSIVSYYPSKEKPFIKYINNDIDFKNLDKIFVSGSLGGNGKTIKNKNGCILVFCSAPLYYKKEASNKTTSPTFKTQKQTI